MVDRPDEALRRALAEGTRRSREAQVSNALVPRDARSLATSPGREPATPAVQEPPQLAVWRRHKWKIVGLLVLLVTEFVLFVVGSTARGP